MRSLLLVASTFGSIMVLAGLSAQATERPNIVLIFADDLGWKDVGYQGSSFCETPNIDRLAQEGMVFSNGYAAAGNCAPSRACLLSGNYTPRHSVYAVGSTLRGPQHLMRMVPIPNKSGLAPENVTMADALQAAGYVTGIFGKWHLAGNDGAEPGKQGFDVVVDKNYKGSGVNEDPKGIYTLTKAACEFMETNKDRPFFAFVSHHAIHTGLQARQATLNRFSSGETAVDEGATLYAGCTYDLDDGVGILLDKLRELGLDSNTLVVFTSDNGATAKSPQEPLRGNKGCYYEGGIREPFIIRWPAVVPPSTRCDVPVINVDLYPTFLAAAGAAVPEGKVLDGESLLPLLRANGRLQRDAIFWHFPGYLNGPVIRGRDPVFRTRPVSVIRKGDWKLHLYHEEWQLDGGRERLESNNAVELYNLVDDIGERKNLATVKPTVRDELLNELLAWFAEAGVALPTETNPKYAPDQPVSEKKKGRGNSERSNRPRKAKT